MFNNSKMLTRLSNLMKTHMIYLLIKNRCNQYNQLSVLYRAVWKGARVRRTLFSCDLFPAFILF